MPEMAERGDQGKQGSGGELQGHTMASDRPRKSVRS